MLVARVVMVAVVVVVLMVGVMVVVVLDGISSPLSLCFAPSEVYCS